MRYSKNGTQHVFCLKCLVAVILMGQNVDKWVKYFNGCCMWTNETLLSVSACNEPHVAGGRGGIYLLVFTWYLYWRIWSLLQLSAVSPGQAIIQLLSHQLPVTTSTRTHRDTSVINSNVGDPWLHFAIRFQPNWSEVIQLEGEVLQFCWKRNNLQSLKNVRLAGCVEVEQTSPRSHCYIISVMEQNID